MQYIIAHKMSYMPYKNNPPYVTSGNELERKVGKGCYKVRLWGGLRYLQGPSLT